MDRVTHAHLGPVPGPPLEGELTSTALSRSPDIAAGSPHPFSSQPVSWQISPRSAPPPGLGPYPSEAILLA